DMTTSAAPSERRSALGRDQDPPTLHHYRHHALTARELQQLGDRLAPRTDVDLVHHRAACGERGAHGVAVRAAGLRVEEDRRRHRQVGTSVPQISVAAELNTPPRPWQTAVVAPATCRAPHSARSWRTASTSVNMPYMPLWVYDRPPPLVFMGKAPPGAVRPP